MKEPPGRSRNWIKDFSSMECEYFRSNCNFTEREQQIFDLRNEEKSAVSICNKLHISPETFYRDLKRIKWKIYKVL